MNKRLTALLAALVVTFASLGPAALENTDEQIAKITESIYSLQHDETVVLAEDEDYDSYSGDTSDPCLDEKGYWICEDYYYEDDKGEDDKDEDEDYYYSGENEEWNEQYDWDDEDYYDECYDSAGNYLCYEEEYEDWEDEDWGEYDYADEEYDDYTDYEDDDYYYEEHEKGEEDWNDESYEDYYIDWDNADDAHVDLQTEELKMMIEEIEWMLEDLEEFVDDAKEFSDEADIEDSLRALEEIMESGEDLIDSMNHYADQGLTDDQVYEFWNMVDYLWETTDKHIIAIEDALMIDGGVHSYEDEDYDDDYFEDYYGGEYDYDKLLDGFDYEDTDEVTRLINEELMHELAEHADNPYAQELVSSVMNNLDVLDEEVIESLEFTAELFDVMADMEVPDENDPKYDRLKELYEKSFVLLTETAREDMIAAWTEVRSVVEAGASESQLNELAEQIEALLSENETALVLTHGIGYYDVPLEQDDWYFDDVQELKDEGIIGGFKDENGNPTGYYGPSELITKAEMLKLVLEVSQRGESNAMPKDSSAIGQWYQGYVAQFENMGMSYGGNWNEPITRRVAAVWISEAMELHEKVDGYNGEFSDVSSTDDDAIHFAAVYEYEVFTGDSGAATLRPDDNMNRAEAAKVVRVAMEEVLERAASYVNDTLDSFLEEYAY